MGSWRWWEACELSADEGPGRRNEQRMAARRGAVRAAFLNGFQKHTGCDKQESRGLVKYRQEGLD